MRLYVLPSLGLSVAQASRDLGIARQTLHRILSGRAAVTPAMALRLERFCGVPRRFWLERQIAHDLDRLGEGDLADVAQHTLAFRTLERIGGTHAG